MQLDTNFHTSPLLHQNNQSSWDTTLDKALSQLSRARFLSTFNKSSLGAVSIKTKKNIKPNTISDIYSSYTSESYYQSKASFLIDLSSAYGHSPVVITSILLGSATLVMGVATLGLMIQDLHIKKQLLQSLSNSSLTDQALKGVLEKQIKIINREIINFSITQGLVLTIVSLKTAYKISEYVSPAISTSALQLSLSVLGGTLSCATIALSAKKIYRTQRKLTKVHNKLLNLTALNTETESQKKIKEFANCFLKKKIWNHRSTIWLYSSVISYSSFFLGGAALKALLTAGIITATATTATLISATGIGAIALLGIGLIGWCLMRKMKPDSPPDQKAFDAFMNLPRDTPFFKAFTTQILNIKHSEPTDVELTAAWDKLFTKKGEMLHLFVLQEQERILANNLEKRKKELAACARKFKSEESFIKAFHKYCRLSILRKETNQADFVIDSLKKDRSYGARKRRLE